MKFTFTHTLALTLALLLGSTISVEAQTTVLSPFPATLSIGFEKSPAPVVDGYALWVDDTRQTIMFAPIPGVADNFYTAFPALTPAEHRIQLTAFVLVDGKEIDGDKTSALTVKVVVVPGPPTNLRLITLAPGQAQVYPNTNAPFLLDIREGRGTQVRTHAQVDGLP